MVRELSPEKRERLLAAALTLFVAKGVANTSTAEIAREAGTAAGTLFLYFPTKQALVDELALGIAQEITEVMSAQLSPSLSARESFAAIWNGTLRWFQQHMDAYNYIRQVRDSGMISEEVVRQTDALFAFYYIAIQKGLEEGSIKPYPPELTGGFLYQGIVAVMNLVGAQPDPAQQEAYIRQGFELFWDGIKTGEGGPLRGPEA